MARGKQKGFKKSTITIKDDVLEPYYISVEEKQYVLMKEGSTIAVGYYGKLANALQTVAKLVNLERNASKTLSIRGFIDTLEEMNESILKVVEV